MPSKTRANERRYKFRLETVVAKLESNHEKAKIATTFIPLAPDKILFGLSEVDLLVGVFHIMWEDMPSPRSYGLRLADNISSDGKYLGCTLLCSFPRERNIPCQTV